MTSKRRTLIPETEREFWRRVFLDEVLSRRRVQNIISQELRPLVQTALSERRKLLENLEGQELLRAIDEGFKGTAPPLDSQIAYREKLDQVVRDSLRCRHSGQHSPWFARYFAVAVEDQLPDRPFLPDPDEELRSEASRQALFDAVPFWPNGEPAPLFEVVITFQVGPYGATVQRETLDIPDNEPMADANFLEFEFSDPTGRWDDWSRLETFAHVLLDHSLRQLRTEYEYRFPQKRNSQTEAQFSQDAKDLASYLVDKKPFPDKAARQQLKRFADLIGL